MRIRRKRRGIRPGEINNVFSPSAPVNRQSLFAGRMDQIQRVLNAVSQRGQHVVVFGERGVGKTSLANVVSEVFQNASDHFISVLINCDSSDDFGSIWRKVFNKIDITYKKQQLGLRNKVSDQKISLINFIPDGGQITPGDVENALSFLDQSCVIVFDELDRICDKRTTTLLADTVKTLSDHSSNVTLILVGVAKSVEELISEHASIERALLQIQMPRMSKEELIEILDKSLSELEMSIDDEEKQFIASLSQGLPHYVHLIGQQSAISSINGGRQKITFTDVEIGIESSLRNA